MAKKSKSSKKRKQRKPNVPVYSVPSDSDQQEAASAKPAAAVATQAPISNPLASKDATTDSIDWPKEYPFFMPDMKRLGIVTALMVALLLAMNLIFIYVL
jgi:hypothetical protein